MRSRSDSATTIRQLASPLPLREGAAERAGHRRPVSVLLVAGRGRRTNVSSCPASRTAGAGSRASSAGRAGLADGPAARLNARSRVVKDRAAVVVHHSGVSAVGEDELHNLELRPAAPCRVEC